MEISVIASGSNGNCCLIEQKIRGKDRAIMVDAGKSGREIAARMDSLGKSIENVDAILITHLHHDHICGAGVLARRFNIPIYITKDVFEEAHHKMGRLDDGMIKSFSLKKSFKVNGIGIHSVSTSHNVSSCGFVFGNGAKFGLFTDTGIVTREMHDIFPKLKGVLLESNHDIKMVKNGPYPYFLKKWILGDTGHLNNEDCSRLIQERGENLSLALMGHLSGNNNTPDVAKETYEGIVKRKIEFGVCSRDCCSGQWEI